ncbi:MAG: methyltransferase [Pseudomonadota bacterium]
MAFVTPLLLPFESGELEVPEGPGVFVNAELPKGVEHTSWRGRLTCVQAWRDRHLSLAGAGYETTDKLESIRGHYAFALVMLSKHRAEARADIVTATRLVTPGGPIIIGGPKKVGAASIRKSVGETVEIEASFSKSHWQVFIIRAGADANIEQADAATPVPVPGFETGPGMFSHAEVDPGSQLLAESLPHGSLGHLADFGCGWGYLSVEALNRGRAQSVTMIDAHAPSLEAARKNLLAHHPGSVASTHWLDIAREDPPSRFDTIIMNPPFHTEQETNVNLGVTFIERAARSAKPGGQLLMVANRHLPYENVLERCFRRWSTLQSNNRFKVFAAFR